MPPRNPVLRGVPPNAGIKAAYYRKLKALIDEMQRSIVYWVTARYRAEMAQDSAANELQDETRRLRKQWESRFDDGAEKLGRWFAQKNKSYADGSLKTILKDAGFTIEFKMTESMQNAYSAAINANVTLIKSIASHHLDEVEGLVMRSVQVGGDLATLSKELVARYGITKRRAGFIARDQNNKATAIFTRTRQLDIGMTSAVWKHSHAGKVPRPSHLKADGELYDIRKGMYLDGEWVLPGEKINCLPGNSIVVSPTGCNKLWRRWYSGELLQLVTESGKTIEATPNHPVLTQRGWVGMKSVNCGDNVVTRQNHAFDGLHRNVKGSESTFAQAFDSASFLVRSAGVSPTEFQFHGDVAHSEVEVIDFDSFLPSELDAVFCQEFCEFFFTKADHAVETASRLKSASSFYSAVNALFCPPQSVIGGAASLLSLLESGVGSSKDIGDRLISDLHASISENFSDSAARAIELACNSQFTQSGNVSGNHIAMVYIFALLSRASNVWGGQSPDAEILAKKVSGIADVCGYPIDCGTLGQKIDRVVEKSIRDFSGHVFNLESKGGWYIGNDVIIHNCGCYARIALGNMNAYT